MKKLFTLALLAVMALGSLTFVSCDKENDVIDNQTEQIATKDAEFPPFPIELMNFTDSNNAIWTVWGGYELLGRRGIRFDIKFHPTFSTSRVIIRHFIGTVEFRLDGSYIITGGDFRITPEIEIFLRDFARYWLNH